MQQTGSLVVSMTSLVVRSSIPIFTLDVVRGMIGPTAYIVCKSWMFSRSDN